MKLDNLTDKQLQQLWQEHCDNIRKATAVKKGETEEQKQERIKRLEAEGNEEEWFKYYFPHYCFAPSAVWQQESTRKWLREPRVRQSRKWARGLSKSTRRMMEIMYKKFVLKFRINMLLVSKSEDNAINLLNPYRAEMEANELLANDYGLQRLANSKWTDYHFTTSGDDSFMALGAQQSPRGVKLKEMRPNMIVLDDVDDDEVCENTDRLDKRWRWIMRALLPTIEISKDWYVFFDNNVIAEDCLALRFAKLCKPEFSETVNIRDENERSMWPEKNSEADIDEMFEGWSWEDIQAEYYNNPTSNSKTFGEPTYEKCPPMETMQFLVQYADPSPGGRDKPGIKSKAQNSSKATVLLGMLGHKLYVYKAFVDHMTSAKFIDSLYAIRNMVPMDVALYNYIENNSLQDPFYGEVYLPLIYEKAKDYGGMLSVMGDDRKKPEKWTRIEASLEPLYRLGNLVFNIDEKESPGMKTLVAQFKTAKATSKTLDGPDAVEGGYFKIKQKMTELSEDAWGYTARERSASKHI